jgi:N-acetylglucosamine kinase-like BadF-type ATPase
MNVFVGVDGGGTHARAVAVDETGRELARHAGPAGLVDPREPGAAAAVVARVTRGVLEKAGAAQAVALCCGLAGAGREQEREAIRVALTLEHVAGHVVVTGDAEAAMADAFPEGDGVLVVAGTGSIAWARADRGAPVRVGGWGQVLGDEGSGYAIGVGALRAVVHAADRGVHTKLTESLLEGTALGAVQDLVAWVASASKAQVAALAPVVIACAASGDATAGRIVDQAVLDIAALAVSAARKVGATTARIALTGGLIAPGGPLRDNVARALRAQLPGATLYEGVVDAALGAAAIARRDPRG